MNHILIAEDEHLIARLVEMTLTRAGYRCTVAEDGRTAADLIEKTDFDMAILDIMLPGLDGYDLLASLKPQGVPVIFLTAKSAVKDRVLGLRLGADDYITKPFAAEELVARMETVLRRTGRGGRELRAFDIRLDTQDRTAWRGDAPLDLRRREFDLLELLMRNRGAALYRDVIFSRVWGGEPDSECLRTVDTHIARLRKKTAFVFQTYNLFRNKTALQNVTEGLIVARKLPKEQAEEIGMKMLAKVGLADRADYYPRQLSGGQQQRVASARALAADPEIIYFDEPTSALDPELTGDVLRVLRDLADRKTTMIIVTHEMHFARDVADRILFMDGGVVVEEGPAKQLIDHPREQRTKQFLAHYAE